MSFDKRNYERQSFVRTCWLGPKPIREGHILDVSDGGARVVVRNARELPEQLILYLTRDMRVGRRCRLAWRTSHGHIGLEFLGPLDPTGRHREIVTIS